MEGCSVASEAYEGNESEPGAFEDDCEGVDMPSTLAGINFHINKGSESGLSVVQVATCECQTRSVMVPRY